MSQTSPESQGSWTRRATFGVAIVIVALGAGALGGFVARSTSSGSSIGTASNTSSSPCSVSSVATKDLSAVVTISVRSSSSGSTGSGEVIRSDGYIVTNNHVIASAASGGTITVLFDNGTSLPAHLQGRDPLTDLAVVKVDTSKALPTIPIGDSAKLRVGQPVVALGAPLGLSSTVTAGIVSALDRTISVPGEGSSTAVLVDAIQTDAAINPGNSGGALVDCAGKLVGIPSAGASVPSASGEATNGGDIGLGFAIPVDSARTIWDELISTGSVTHAYLGLEAEPLSPDVSRSSSKTGLYVTSVQRGGPAEKAGIRTGDVITAIDGSAATSTDQLVELSITHSPGTKVTLDVERSGKRSTTTVVLGTEP